MKANQIYLFNDSEQVLFVCFHSYSCIVLVDFCGPTRRVMGKVKRGRDENVHAGRHWPHVAYLKNITRATWNHLLNKLLKCHKFKATKLL